MRANLAALVVTGLGLLLALSVARADGATELLELRNTVLNLVDALVDQGVLTPEVAERMKRDAAIKARQQAAQAGLAEGRATEAPAVPGTAVVRVPYVPDFVKDEIRAEVREELRAEVTQDVVAVAKAEKWGTPDALPDWVNRLEFSGDLRLRGSGVYYDSGNDPAIPNFQAINQAGGPAAAGANVFLNSTENVTRAQLRLRLGLEAAVADGFSVVTRLATGNAIDPTTRDQRLGNYNRPFDLVLELAYVDWTPAFVGDTRPMVVRGGRLPAPFYQTELLFDDDLTFDGFTFAYRGDLPWQDQSWLVNLGGFTLLGETANLIDGGTDAKYWWGGQLGLDLRLSDDLGLVVAGAYYDFVNVTGRRNDFNSTSRDWTAPAFIAKGNTVFDIRNDNDPETQLFALASEFELLNALLELDYRRYAPIHVILRADYVRNIGFDRDDVSSRVNTTVTSRNQGWYTQLEVGFPQVRAARQWRAWTGYRYLQRDAILDSFADSNFHAGGTDAKGWVAGFEYGLFRNSWVRARWLAADEIDGAPAGFGAPFAPFAIDVFQVDLNAKF